VVGLVEVGDHEVDELCAEMVWHSKLERQRYLAKGYNALTWQNAQELSVIWFQLRWS